jgi:hypothetical protein
MRPTGYLHPDYARSLDGFGQPLALRHSGGWLLSRRIPGVPDDDATGCYPLFCCTRWDALLDDLSELRQKIVTTVFVGDPFAGLPRDHQHVFSHGIEPYKEHTVVDLERPIEQSVCASHRRKARRALAHLQVDVLETPTRHLAEWRALYRELIARHRIRGISAFSDAAFARQLAIPGMVALRASAGEETVGMNLWFLQGEVGYFHLGACSQRGYELLASFAMFWSALEFFRGQLGWLNLGAGAGVRPQAADGLARFKRGWSPLTRTAYLYRHVLQPRRYAALCQGLASHDYFPAYRHREIAATRAA